MKTFTTANKTQEQLKQRCLEEAKKHVIATGDHFDVTLEDEQVLECNGALSFFIRVTAKPNSGMLFICNKSFLVFIGRKGRVRSMETGKDKNLKDNKYLIFI